MLNVNENSFEIHIRFIFNANVFKICLEQLIRPTVIQPTVCLKQTKFKFVTIIKVGFLQF